MDPVFEDEAPPPSTDPRVRVASSGPFVNGSSAEGLHVGTVDCKGSPDEGSRFDERFCQGVEDSVVGFLSESVSEVCE